MSAVAEPLLRSFGSEGIAFFNQLRTPAALVAAAAIKDAFVMQSAPEDIKRSRGWTLLRELYLLFQLLSFSTELSSVFFATQAIARLQLRPSLNPIDLQVCTLPCATRKPWRSPHILTRPTNGQRNRGRLGPSGRC